MFKKLKLIYRLVACLAIVIYFTYYGQDTIKSVNDAMKSAMIESGEISEENSIKKTQEIKIDKKLLDFLNQKEYKNLTAENKKIVFYTQKTEVIEAYMNSAAWRERFSFVELHPDKNNKHYNLLQNKCGELCVVDLKNKKFASIPKEKTNDSKYLYDVLADFYN